MANLDPALQDSIDNLQTRHTALVDAVRNYSGGSIAGATNDLLAARDDVMTTIDARETALLGLIQQQADKPVPSMLLDFKDQIFMHGTRRLERGVALADLLSIRRASSKWVNGPQGKVVEVPPDTPAYHYDPITGESLGILRESSATNVLFPSASFESWSGDAFVEDTTQASVIEGDFWQRLVTSVSGGDDNTNVRHKTFTYEAGKRYTLSTYAKPDELDVISLRLPGQFGGFYGASVNISTGAIVETIGTITASDVAWIPYPDGSARIAITGVCETSGTGQTRVYVGNLSKDIFDGTSGILTSGANLTEGYLSSYIPSVDSPVTRATDVIDRVMGDEFNPAGCTIVVDYTLMAPRDNESGTDSLLLMNVSNGIVNIRHGVTLGNLDCYGRLDGITFIDSGGPAYSIGTPAKVAASWGNTGSEVAFSGWPGNGGGAAMGDPQLQGLNNPVMALGDGSNISIRSVTLYPHEIFGADLEAFVSV